MHVLVRLKRKLEINSKKSFLYLVSLSYTNIHMHSSSKTNQQYNDAFGKYKLFYESIMTMFTAQ